MTDHSSGGKWEDVKAAEHGRAIMDLPQSRTSLARIVSFKTIAGEVFHCRMDKSYRWPCPLEIGPHSLTNSYKLSLKLCYGLGSVGTEAIPYFVR